MAFETKTITATTSSSSQSFSNTKKKVAIAVSGDGTAYINFDAAATTNHFPLTSDDGKISLRVEVDAIHAITASGTVYVNIEGSDE